MFLLQRPLPTLDSVEASLRINVTIQPVMRKYTEQNVSVRTRKKITSSKMKANYKYMVTMNSTPKLFLVKMNPGKILSAIRKRIKE